MTADQSPSGLGNLDPDVLRSRFFSKIEDGGMQIELIGEPVTHAAGVIAAYHCLANGDPYVLTAFQARDPDSRHNPSIIIDDESYVTGLGKGNLLRGVAVAMDNHLQQPDVMEFKVV